jgi:3-oxoacyl-[acyl-carrier-protein] synthase II
MNLKRVVVTGLGALTPIGNDVAAMWQSMLAGVSGAGPITRFNTEKFKCKIACEVKGFDSSQFFDRKEVRKLDLFTQYGLVAADEAIREIPADEGERIRKAQSILQTSYDLLDELR